MKKKNIKYIYSKETFSSFNSAEIAKKKNCKKTNQTNKQPQKKDPKNLSSTSASKLICVSFHKCLELRTRGYSCVNTEHFHCVSNHYSSNTGRKCKQTKGRMPSRKQKNAPCVKMFCKPLFNCNSIIHEYPRQLQTRILKRRN